MSNDNPLKRYGPETEYDAPSPYLVMREAPGGSYIDEYELRSRLKDMFAVAYSDYERDAYKRILKLLDTPNW